MVQNSWAVADLVGTYTLCEVDSKSDSKSLSKVHVSARGADKNELNGVAQVRRNN